VIYRQTLAAPVLCAGIALHSGDRVRMVMKPAPAGYGIVFIRTDIIDKYNRVDARAEFVTGVRLGTTISNDDGVSVSTVEKIAKALGITMAELFTNNQDLKEVHSLNKTLMERVSLIDSLNKWL